MKKVVLSVFLLVGISFPALAESEIHIIHCLKGCPIGAPPTNDLIISHIYALSSNDDTKFADWVAYQVTSDTIGTTDSYQRNWQSDVNLEATETLEPEDYKGASEALRIDRGHQAPLAAFGGTVFWRETNILSNITPQKSVLNQGPWEKLERAERNAAYSLRAVWSITGPLYERALPPLPQADEPHHLPSGYWKIIATKEGRVSAFVFDQDTPGDANYCDTRFRVPSQRLNAEPGSNCFRRPMRLGDRKISMPISDAVQHRHPDLLQAVLSPREP